MTIEKIDNKNYNVHFLGVSIPVIYLRNEGGCHYFLLKSYGREMMRVKNDEVEIYDKKLERWISEEEAKENYNEFAHLTINNILKDLEG